MEFLERFFGALTGIFAIVVGFLIYKYSHILAFIFIIGGIAIIIWRLFGEE